MAEAYDSKVQVLPGWPRCGPLDVQQLTELRLDPERRLPVLLVSLRRGAPAVDPAELGRQLAGLGQMELEIKRERILDSISKRRAAGKDLGGRRQSIGDSQVRSALQLVEAGEPAAQVARDLGMSRATFYRRVRAMTRPPTLGSEISS